MVTLIHIPRKMVAETVREDKKWKKTPILFSVYKIMDHVFVCHTSELDVAFKIKEVLSKNDILTYITYGCDHVDFLVHANSTRAVRIGL